MKQFDVLDRKLKMHQHYLLEASAGTGKTFSIQNIVVRLLIEPHKDKAPLLLQEILVVTFTRAATSDLKLRIRSNIEQALDILQNWLSCGEIKESIPDYLKACIEAGQDFTLEAIKNLKQALFTFDQSQIFTIHSFCARMLRQFALESDMGFVYFSGEDPLPYTELMQIISDFFRTEVRIDEFCPSQLEILMKEDPEHRKLLKAIQTGYEFSIYPSFKEIYLKFLGQMHEIKEEFSLNSESLIEDFINQAQHYKNYQPGVTKSDVLKKVERFALLFDQNDWSIEDLDALIHEGFVWVKALDPKLKKEKKNQPPISAYPGLTAKFASTLEPLIDQSSCFSILLLRMAEKCRRLLKRYQDEEEKLSPDDILRKMLAALLKKNFLSQVQQSFQAAIIDEFQDTDPLQWQIFYRLFLSSDFNWSGYLYLVGDPKQSIYSFRQADIYTYLQAAQELGNAYCFSLDINYRSQPNLVEALNTLFSEEHLPNFIPLPKKASSLAYQPVRAGVTHSSQLLDDDREAIHFFITNGDFYKKPSLEKMEQNVFFPFIAQELSRLVNINKFRFSQFAILVRDRNQATRLAKFFNSLNIPYLNQRGTNLTDSSAIQGLIDLLRAVLRPHDRGAILTALGGPILGWNSQEIKVDEKVNSIRYLLQNLKKTLFENGFAAFFQELLKIRNKTLDFSLYEELLSREGGSEFFRDLQQITNLIVEYRYREWSSPEGIISFLDQLHFWEKNDDARIKRFQDPTVEGVKILTLHSSKGLEFDVVFALGLINRTSIKEDYLPVERQGDISLKFTLRTSADYILHCEENDAEKMRQLYVAMTRAKYRLYIPVALNLNSDRIDIGEASPMDLFICRLGLPSASHKDLYDRLKKLKGENLIKFLNEVGNSHFITYSIHKELTSLKPLENPSNTCLELISPKKVIIPGEILWMSSFSSLGRHSEKTVEIKTGEIPPHDYQCCAKTIHTMPANRHTGLLIHSILEKLDFKQFKKMRNADEALLSIKFFLKKTLLEGWESVVGELLFNLIKTPFFGQDNERFSLSELDTEVISKEMPFIFPSQNEIFLEEVVCKKGFIKGVLDLLFYHDGRYYLVDWKTNWLGSSSECYGYSSIEAAMNQHDYFLQASLYTEAIKRYLKIIDSRPFEECFAGGYYLFLRGICPKKLTGCYHLEPIKSLIIKS